MEEKLHSGKFTLIENDQEIEYTTLFTFYNDRTKKNYVVYTDNTEDEEGNKQIFASSYNPEDPPVPALPCSGLPVLFSPHLPVPWAGRYSARWFSRGTAGLSEA